MVGRRLTIVLLLLSMMMCLVSSQENLQLGKPFFTDIAKDTFAYFILPALSQPIDVENKLIFSLTSISGDADIYLSTSNRNPGPNSFELKSSTLGEDLIMINSSFSQALRTGPWYLGVQAYHTDTYLSLIGYTTNSHILLGDGVPQVAHVLWREFTYFKYVATTPGTFTISSTAIYGDPDVYISDVAEFPSRTNFTTRKTGVGTDLISITPDASETFPKIYYIAIYGFGRDSYFNIEVTYETSIALLAANIPLFERVPARNYMYFKFKLTSEHDVTFKVVNKNSFVGDPDIYISTTSQAPNATNYQWKGTNAFRSETVTIQKGSPGWAVNTWYYIGVLSNSFFASDVSVTVETGGHILLTSGNSIPMNDIAGKVSYYKALFQVSRYDHVQYLEFTVTPSNGGTVEVYGSKTNQFPTSADHEFVGSSVFSSNVIHIDSATNGWYYIAVVATSDVSYTITATQARMFVTLDSGISQSFSILGGQYRDFGFSAEREEDILISVHSLTGDADFFVGIEPSVNRSNYIWASYLGSSDVVRVSKNDPARQLPEFSGQLFIAVYGFTDAYFSISAYYDNSTIELTDGVPVSGVVNRGVYSYFRYTLTNPGSLSFNLKALDSSDDPDMYIATEYPNPTREHKQWESWKLGDDFLNIPNAQATTYYIGVYGFFDNTTFILSVSAEYESLSSFGYSIVDYVAQGNYRYYSTYLYPDTVNPLTVGITLVSGHTELYVSRNASKPSTSTYDYKDVSWPGNFLSVNSSELNYGRWMFAVYGVESSYYLIHSSTRQIQGSLRKGEPKLGVVQKGTYALFKLSYYSGTQSGFYVYVNQVDKIPGRLGVYVDQYPNQQPNMTNARWKQEGDDDILVNLDGMSSSASVFVAVYAFDQDTRFQIVVAETSEPVYLTEEQPNKVRAIAGQSNYFEVPALPTATGIQVVAASCSDNLPPRIYGSTTVVKPDPSHSDFTSSPDGKFRQIASSTKVTNNLYYLGTEAAASEFVYSIYATTAGDERPVPTGEGKLVIGDLVSTTQQRIHVPKATGRAPIRYFMYKRVLKPNEVADNINMLTVCAIQNEASGSMLVGEIEVPPTLPDTMAYDIPVDNNQRYIINVIAVDAHGLATAYQQINFNLGKTNVITLGNPLRSSVNGTQYAQLTLPNAQVANNDQLLISLTPFTGDVDLYVSTSENPTKDNAIWKGTGGGFDIITIPRSDPNWPASDNFFVAVYGVSPGESAFSVMAYSAAVTQVLLDGQPQLAKVTSLKYTYFVFDLDDNSTFTINLTPLSGDPDLIASNKFSNPTTYNAEFHSAGTSVDSIIVKNSDSRYLPYTKYYIGVYGFGSSDSLFSLTATKEYTNEMLTEGVAHGRTLSRGETNYFKFQLTSPRSLLINLIVASEGGDPDIFVSTTVQRPSYFQNTWKHTDFGQDVLEISKDDPNWVQGWYYIAVKAYMRDCTFTITVLSEETTYVLTDGSAQVGRAVAEEYIYYRAYYGYTANEMLFTVNPVVENAVELYCAKFSKPTREKYEYVGQTDGAYLYVPIPQDSQIGWYYCSVYAKVATDFTMTASSNQRPITLYEGKLDMQNYVERGFYAYFTFDFDSGDKRDVTISINPSFGDPDLYVSYNYTRPTKEQHQYSNDNGGRDSVVIHAADIPAGTSRFYIGVYGFTPSRFDIVAFSTNETIELQDATPIPGYVAPNQYKQFKYELTNGGRVKFTLVDLDSSAYNVALYVDTKENPNAAQYKYKGEEYGNDIVEFVGSKSMYYIAVHGARDGGNFLLSASTEYETISVGSYITDFADASNYRYYRTVIPSRGVDHVLASVTLINGKTELYAHPGEDKPSRTNSTYRSTDYPGNFLYVSSRDPNFKTGTWTFAVYAHDDSDYFVSVQYQEGTLYNGIPRIGYVTPGDVTETIYYSYYISGRYKQLNNVTVNVRPFVDPNSACIRVYASTNKTDIRHNYKYFAYSEPKYGNQVVFNIQESSFTRIYFAVESCSGKPEKYEISVNNNIDFVYLTQNYASLFSSQASQYTVMASKHSNLLSIEVDSCDNTHAASMRLVASTKNPDPTPPYIGETSQANPFTLKIMSSNVEGSAKYYIGVTPIREPLPSMLSIFTTTTNNDPRPIIGDLAPALVKKTKVGGVQQSVMQVSFNGNKAQLVSVFLHEVTGLVDEKEPNVVLSKVNMATVCGIRMNSNLTIVANVTGADTATFTVDTKKAYILGAIITDVAKATEKAYTPVVILDGGRIVLPKAKFSVGALFIFFAMIAIVAYLIIGISYNLIKGEQKGIYVIPFVEFWMDLPWLIVDGVKFIVYCGREGGKYESFEDEHGVADDNDEPNPFKVSNVDTRSSQSTSSGYGAI